MKNTIFAIIQIIFIMPVLEKTPIEKLITPFQNIVRQERAGAIILFISVIIALVLANTSLSDSYHSFLSNTLALSFNGQTYLEYDLIHWINDGLMAIFFFVVGLELKKEFVAGELSSPKKALIPISAAIGGMAIPALVYYLLNTDPVTQHGWGIPMATDIAFALGILMFLGKRVPVSLKVFLLALAIVDDLGAILVIALFYSSEISFFNLMVGFTFLAIMFIGNRMGVRSTLFYAILGIGGLWTAFLLSGVHATIAAVLAAFMIPAESRIKEGDYLADIKDQLKAFEAIDPDDKIPVLKEEQIAILNSIKTSTKLASTPMQNLTNIISPISTFIVLPIFAIANAGVSLSVDIDTLFSTNIAVGVAMGLLAGKVIGIVGFTFILVKMGVGSLPKGMNFKNLTGLSFLASIGFTMSIFVGSLAFTEQLHLDQAKIGIFAGSIIGGLIGYFYLSFVSKPTES